MTVQEAIGYLRMATDEADEYSSLYVEMCKMSIKALEELEQYRALGTVEELKEAREKQVAKKIQTDINREYCGKCGHLLRIGYDVNFCEKCGQKIDWTRSDEDE